MYAVVEFESRTCAVVPINWLTDNEQKCYWPKAKTTNEFQKLVKTSKEPAHSWPKYDVIKVLKITADYNDADKILQKIIDDNTTSDTGEATKPLNVKLPDVDEDGAITDEALGESIQGVTRDKRKVEGYLSSESLSDFSDDDSSAGIVGNNTLSTSQESTVDNHYYLSSVQTPLESLPSPVPSTSSSTSNTVLLEAIVRKLEHVVNTQNQQTLMLNHILSSTQNTNITSLNKPQDLPSLPVNNKQEYKNLEEFLKSEEKFNYLKCRLACIGGTCVRNAVMNMMKFILSDKVAMKFNWAGRDHKKRAFKDTHMSRVVQEAVMTAFSKHCERSDLTDRCIQDAMKDWLKLSKHRFENKNKRLRAN